MEKRKEIEEKRTIFNEHNARAIISNAVNINPLVERFHWMGEAEKLSHEIHCSQLIHFTENKFALNIGFDNSDNFGFKSQKWNHFDKEIDHYFVWWSPLAPDGWDNGISRDNPEHQKYYCNSPAFNGESLCGPIGFVVSWKDILEQYAKSRGKSVSKIQLKYFGTFFYSREIMYAIIVCLEGDQITYKDDDGNEQIFSVIENDTEAFGKTNDNKMFTWKLYSTANWGPSSHKDNPWGTWDHLSFAFYYPDKNNTLIIPPNLCSIKTKKAAERRPYSRTNFSGRKSHERVPDSDIVKKLADKINQSKNKLN